MIRSWFGLAKTPFDADEITLLSHQQRIIDILGVHCRQGGLCVILGDPGVGKSYLKRAIQKNADKTQVVVSIGRTLHSYPTILKQLCYAFAIEADGLNFRCEKRIIDEAFALSQHGKSLVTIIDDAHLLDMEVLRRLRLLFDDFPPNHNVILIGQGSLMSLLSFKVNEDIKSRITYSTFLGRLPNDVMKEFILAELDKVKLGHNVFSLDALDLIVRSADGFVRRARNLCRSCLVMAVRGQTKEVDLAIVNEVLVEPHWRMDVEDPSHLRGVS
jgi:MSHA biogenesis protein MshM